MQDDAARRQPPPEPEGWQPIATAPTNGTIVLLGSAHESGRYVGHFASKTGGRKHWLSIPGAWERNPTHWMPLAAPPLDLNVTEWEDDGKRVMQSIYPDGPQTSEPVAPPCAKGGVLDLPEAAFQSASAALSAPPATPGADLRAALKLKIDEWREMATAAFRDGPIPNDEAGHASRWATVEMLADELAALLDAPKEPKS